MDLKLNDKVFIVTGGTAGLGYAAARVLYDEGSRVVVSGRSVEKLDRARATGFLPERSAFLLADNASEDTARKLVDLALERFGRLDGALISVGGPMAGPATGISDDAWRSSFDTVFLGAVRLIRTLSETMAEAGSIALLLSVSAKAPLRDMAISNGLRPGLAALVKTFARELGPRNIRVNALLPGPFATDRARSLTDAGTPPDISDIPLGRLGEPVEFGRVATFLLSPASSFVTGSSFLVDGGMSPAL
jgi:3-oxoacyl-[acyl-carrier protein] reductase